MSKYGIIYIVHRDTDPEYIFKVGQSTITIEERVADLNSDTTNIGTFKPVAFFVVFDIDGAERDCHIALKSFVLKKGRDFFEIKKKKCFEIVKRSTLKYLAENKNVRLRTSHESELERRYWKIVAEEEEVERMKRLKEEKGKEERKMRAVVEKYEEEKRERGRLKRKERRRVKKDEMELEQKNEEEKREQGRLKRKENRRIKAEKMKLERLKKEKEDGFKEKKRKEFEKKHRDIIKEIEIVKQEMDKSYFSKDKKRLNGKYEMMRKEMKTLEEKWKLRWKI